MGIGGISFWQILIILVVILVLFGGKKIRTMGSDLGEGLKGFKKAIKDEDLTKDSESKSASNSEDILIAFGLISNPIEALADPNMSSSFPAKDGAMVTTSSYFCFAKPLLPCMNSDIAIFNIKPGWFFCCSSALL